MHEHISVGGQTLSGVDGPFDWRVTKLKGWWDSPPLRRSKLNRDGADGGFPLPKRYTERIITITGRVITPDHMHSHEAMDRLSSLLSGGYDLLKVAGHGETTSATVDLDDSVDVDPVTDTRVDFQVRLTAPDPRRYGDTHRLPLMHDEPTFFAHHGSYPARPVLDINGADPNEGYLIYDATGSAWRVPVRVYPEAPHRVDMATGQLWIGGVRSNLATLARPVSLPPNRRTTLRIKAIGGGSVTAFVEYPNTYI